MAFFNWDKKYSVNINDLDNQHKGLIAMVNELYEAMQARKGKDALEKILCALINYTKFHFSLEEKLMKEHQYPELENHKKEHDSLTATVLQLKEQYEKGDITITIKAGNFLKDWLQKHIIGTDKKYSSYLNARGVA